MQIQIDKETVQAWGSELLQPHKLFNTLSVALTALLIYLAYHTPITMTFYSIMRGTTVEQVGTVNEISETLRQAGDYIFAVSPIIPLTRSLYLCLILTIIGSLAKFRV